MSLDTLFVQDRYGSNFQPAGEVPVITLDDVFQPLDISRCDLLKLDCEGAEYETLYASTEALAKTQHIAVEYHVGMNEHGPDSLQRFLQSRGFATTRLPQPSPDGAYGYIQASRQA